MTQTSTTGETFGTLIPPSQGRENPAVPWLGAAVVTMFLPIWATVIVPMSGLYQMGKFAARRIGILSPPTIPNFDSGFKVESSQTIPRSNRQYDVVVLGVTGFCGRLAARHLASTYGMDGSKVKWAMAGRSRAKLERKRAELAAELGVPEADTKVDLIVVDTSAPDTLPALVKNTRVVATTAGPYTVMGNHVVEFCAKFGTHYVDITGEINWVQAMYCLWQETAKETGAKIVSCCGHDSIPWDLSVYKMRKALAASGDELTSASFWNEAIGDAPGGTYATMMSFIDGDVVPPSILFDPFARESGGKESRSHTKMNLPLLPSRSDSPWDGSSSSKRWTSPFCMAYINSQICRWSHALRSSAQTPPTTLTYREVMLLPDRKSAVVAFLSQLMIFTLAANPITKYLLKRVLSKQGDGPNLATMETLHFLTVYGVGESDRGKRVETIMYFPKDAGCLETARMMAESALCLALQENDLPNRQGGFWTPATAFGDVIMDRLTQTGTSFQLRLIGKPTS